jgi:hydrogenase expression/formation protein HypD
MRNLIRKTLIDPEPTEIQIMKYISEYRDKTIIEGLVRKIEKASKRRITLMEVCGGHTMAIQKFGIPSLLPETINLKSGPGCPVCVSSRKYIDQAIAYSRVNGVVIATFGDLIRVPGSTSTLDKEKAAGRNIQVVYSILDAIEIARKNPSLKVIFLGIGFETTAPATAAGIIKADAMGLRNLYVYSAHKIMPPAMTALVDDGVEINGYLCPGHVSVITGAGIYSEIADRYRLGCVISGFEPVDILQSVLMLVNQYENNDPKVEIQYSRAVKPEGNLKAQGILHHVFELRDDWWRGLGVLPQSGLKLKSTFRQYDAEEEFDVAVEKTKEDKGCICGEVLKGKASPTDCKLFGQPCHPGNPIGACMVSHEGACHAYYKFT